jgi:eukaryotic-like serine/threonine-protein kinase
VSTSSSATRRQLWRTDGFAALTMVVAVVIINQASDATGMLERRIYDFANAGNGQPSDRIAIIAIDERSIANIGPWPWPRDVHARLIDKLAAAQASTIVYSTFMFEPPVDRGLMFVRMIKAALAVAPQRAQTEQVSKVLAEAEKTLHADAQLAASIAKAGNVLLPSPYPLGAKAAPSMALLAAGHSLNLGFADSSIDPARMLPSPYEVHHHRPAVVVDSFYDVLSGKIPAGKYADKTVVVAATAVGVGSAFVAPGYKGLSPAEVMARITQSILGRDLIVQPAWGGWAAFVALLLVAAYLIALLPKLSAGVAVGVTCGCLVLLAGSEFALLAGASLWLKFMFPAMLLVIGHLALITKRLLLAQTGKRKSGDDSAETHRMMGLALQGQGQLEAAFDRFHRVPMNDAVLEDMYNLALDFERKRQFNTAQSVYTHMAGWNRGFKDLESKLNRTMDLSANAIAGGAAEKRMLGRYRLERELGKGAMGVVYLGNDATLGRLVAIKTLALSQEFQGEEIVDARERFFREAETAGRLQHQNIVTIFDAGEEHDLAYMAMEFLKGKDLVDCCKSGQLLPVAKVLSIAARVAEALAYAHRQNVVHRDIKPANIMYELDSDTVKVTDFGIARITDSSKTKTGLVLGTPSFMSPEQIAGKKVDGRSDLYSLGATLFQMLTGMLPFRGDSMAELMYKIANEEAPDVRTLRKDISERLASVVALSLVKRPESRYQSGDQFAADLRSILAELPRMVAGQNTGVIPVPLPARDYGATALEAKVHVYRGPGYDPRHKTGDATDDFARTALIRKPAAPGYPGAEDDKKDIEG